MEEMKEGRIRIRAGRRFALPDGTVMEPGAEREVAAAVARYASLICSAQVISGEGLRVTFKSATSLGGGDDVPAGGQRVLDALRALRLLNEGAVTLSPLTAEESAAIFAPARP